VSALPPNIPDLSLTKLELGEPKSLMIVIRSNFPYVEALAAGHAQELAMYLRNIRSSVPALDFAVSVWDPDAEGEDEGKLVEFTTRAPVEPDPPATPEANKRYTPPQNGQHHP
jgi:hypothetical protein